MFEMGAKFEDGWQSDNKKKKSPGTESASLPPERHRLRIRWEKRRGRWVTLCGPFSLEKKERKMLLGELKKELGAGGTWKEETLELQGDREEELKRALWKRGYLF